MGSSRVQPAELELAILKVLWKVPEDQLPSSVREVREKLSAAGRDLAHTTVITTLNKMHKKQLVDRFQHKNSFRFQAAVSQDDVQISAVDDILSKLFGGSPKKLLSALLGGREVGAEEIKEIRKLINKKAKETEG